MRIRHCEPTFKTKANLFLDCFGFELLVASQ